MKHFFFFYKQMYWNTSIDKKKKNPKKYSSTLSFIELIHFKLNFGYI